MPSEFLQLAYVVDTSELNLPATGDIASNFVEEEWRSHINNHYWNFALSYAKISHLKELLKGQIHDSKPFRYVSPKEMVLQLQKHPQF